MSFELLLSLLSKTLVSIMGQRLFEVVVVLLGERMRPPRGEPLILIADALGHVTAAVVNCRPIVISARSDRVQSACIASITSRTCARLRGDSWLRRSERRTPARASGRPLTERSANHG